MPRPSDLPDFTAPPLVEVALFTQFGIPANYREIYAYEVWAIFRDAFPSVQELPALPPLFEVFGSPARPQNPSFEFHSGPMRTRFWFVAPDDRELIQYQSDRFVHNWRKMSDDAQYPRYETIAQKYRAELAALNRLFSSRGWGTLAANQAELTYVNRMPLIDNEGKSVSPSFFFKRIDPALMGAVNEFSLSARQVIAPGGKPVARLFMDASMQQGPTGQPFLSVTFTVRGAPTAPTYEASLEFLDRAHILIVHTFAEITSDAAQKMWGRTQ